MTAPAEPLRALIAARHLSLGEIPSSVSRQPWSLDALAGKLVELRSASAFARLTAAFGLVVDTQRRGDVAVWLTAAHGCFFPPDAAEGGADLDTLAVIRLERVRDIPNAADKLIRSSAFGLAVLDLSPPPRSDGRGGDEERRRRARLKDTGAWARLAALARKHDTAVIALTCGALLEPLCAMASTRVEARRLSCRPPVAVGRVDVEPAPAWEIEVTALKDRRRAPGWRHAERCRAPAGLR